jgi:hypothetical protein
MAKMCAKGKKVLAALLKNKAKKDGKGGPGMPAEADEEKKPKKDDEEEDEEDKKGLMHSVARKVKKAKD